MGARSTLLCIHRDPPQLRLLSEHGFKLTTVANCVDAFRVFMSKPVDAIILEHDLSLVNGAALADEIKQVRPDIPIILLAEHVELPANALKSVDALVVTSDGPHFLLATVHFILTVKPAQHDQAKSQGPSRLRKSLVSDRKDAPFSPRVWRNIRNGN